MTLIIFLISVVLSKILADSLVPTEMNVKSHRIIDENAKLAGKYTLNIFQNDKNGQKRLNTRHSYSILYWA